MRRAPTHTSPDCSLCALQALELAPFLEALLANVTGAVGGTVGTVVGTVGGLVGGLLGRRLASAGSVSINVYFTVNRIGGAAASVENIIQLFRTCA